LRVLHVQGPLHSLLVVHAPDPVSGCCRSKEEDPAQREVCQAVPATVGHPEDCGHQNPQSYRDQHDCGQVEEVLGQELERALHAA
jgi:hypothetical protein